MAAKRAGTVIEVMVCVLNLKDVRNRLMERMSWRRERARLAPADSPVMIIEEGANTGRRDAGSG